MRRHAPPTKTLALFGLVGLLGLAGCEWGTGGDLPSIPDGTLVYYRVSGGLAGQSRAYVIGENGTVRVEDTGFKVRSRRIESLQAAFERVDFEALPTSIGIDHPAADGYSFEIWYSDHWVRTIQPGLGLPKELTSVAEALEPILHKASRLQSGQQAPKPSAGI